MPKNTVTDPITDQEMAFAHLILSGTMTDRRAAEAVGLNPETAAYTKSKPRVRAYMIEHRAAVRERLVDQEAEGLRRLNLSRDQILARLWELANLSHEVTRGIIAGQIRALSMIVAIEGLIPSGIMNGRRLSPSSTQTAAPPINAEIYESEWLRKQQHQSASEEPRDAVAATETQPTASHVPDPEPAPEPDPNRATDAPPPPPDGNFDRNFDRNDGRNFDPNQPSLAGPLIPQRLNRVPLAEDSGFNALLNTTSSPRQSFSLKRDPFARGR
jgi:hypothetical protein